MHGEYVKYSNNDGWSEDRRNTPHAFSHFTYEASGRSLVVCDIQGVSFALAYSLQSNLHVLTSFSQESVTCTLTPKSTQSTAAEWASATTGPRAYSAGLHPTAATPSVASSSCRKLELMPSQVRMRTCGRYQFRC